MSRAQHKYLRGVVYPAILPHVPALCDADDLHEYFLCQYFGFTVVDIFGLKRRKPKRRSQDLTTPEMTDFLDFIIKHMQEHGITVPTTERE